MALVFDLAGVQMHLGVVSCNKVVQVLVVVDGRHGLSKAALLRWALSLTPDRADDQAIAQEELLVERGYDGQQSPSTCR